MFDRHWRFILTCKLGQIGLVFGVLLGLVRRSVHARLQVLICVQRLRFMLPDTRQTALWSLCRTGMAWTWY